jgi:BexC/CtrB/KpsE family polysaccharide export inner-membrane protein
MTSKSSHSLPRKKFLSDFEAILWGERRIKKRTRNGIGIFILLLLSLYQWICRRDIYESQGEFLIRGGQVSVTNSLSATLLGIKGGSNEKEVLDAFFLSQEAWEGVDQKLDLGQYFRQNSRDWLWGIRPWSHREDLWRFYQQSIDLDASSNHSVFRLKFRTFEPEKAYAVVTELLQAAEAFVNEIERKTLAERITAIERELMTVNQSIHTARQNFLAFQGQHKLLDPERNMGEELKAISRIEGEKIKAKIQLRELQSYLAPQAPQIRELEQRIASIEEQIREENAKLVGVSSEELNVLSFEYIDLKTHLDFLEKERMVLLKLMEETRVQANQKQKIFIEISKATLPIEPTGPHRIRNILNLTLLMAFVYVTWRIICSIVREHRITSRS